MIVYIYPLLFVISLMSYLTRGVVQTLKVVLAMDVLAGLRVI